MKSLLPSVLALAVSACATLPAAPPAAGRAQAAAYRAAVVDAAIYRTADQHLLRSLPEGIDTVRVVTWTTRPENFPLGEPVTLAGGDLWVTLEPEVQEICRGFAPPGRVLRLQQLLGLPPPERDRTFVILEAAAGEIFRPCPDPDPAAASCSRDFPPNVTADHVAWIARQLLASFQEPGGYPWTRLGYTYDWGPKASDRYGASEYIVRRGATVRPLAQHSTAEYCQTPP